MSKTSSHTRKIVLTVFLIAVIVLSISLTVLLVVQARKTKQPETTSSAAPFSSTVEESSSEEMSSEPDPTGNTVAMPADWDDNGLFSAYYEEAYARMQSMTQEEKVGQMLLARCPETNGAEEAETYHLGGYVLFGRDFEGKTTEEVQDTIASYQQASTIPMAIAVDEEGGDVVRVSSQPTLADAPFASPQELYQEGGLDALASDAAQKARLLNNLGININLAPVADTTTNPDAYMYSRTLGMSGAENAPGIAAMVSGAKGSHVASTLKHFPGYGDNVNTHTGIAVDERSYEEFQNNDFLPFEAGIDAEAECVLVSHNIVNCMDATKPASISPEVHAVLREELGFTGIVMTDDMSMDAISLYTGEQSPDVLAVLAGNDLIITTDYASSYHTILDALENGDIDEELVDHAVWKVLSWKMYNEML